MEDSRRSRSSGKWSEKKEKLSAQLKKEANVESIFYSAPKDMNNTFATIIHAAPKLDVAELITVRKQLSGILAPEFVRECDTNYDLINPVVAQNIDFRKPEDGEVVLRMVNLAKERNIDYTPTHESCQSLHAYCLRKGIPPPEGIGGADGPVPQYVP